MGSIHFLIPRDLSAVAADCTYMVGTDGVPWESHVRILDDRLTVTRATNESGRLVILWSVEGYGQMALATGTLMPVERPYHLPLELARGCLARLMDQLNTAEVRGFKLDDPLAKLLSQAILHFVKASLNQIDFEQAAREAQRSLEHSLHLTQQLGRNPQVTTPSNEPIRAGMGVWGAVVHEVAEVRHLDSVPESVPNVLVLQQSWRDLEVNPGEWTWTGMDDVLQRVDTSQFRVGCGPLVTFNRNELPDWLYLWCDDMDAIQSYYTTYIQQIIKRYAGEFRFWHCAAGTNVDEALGLTEEQRLRLTVSALESARRIDSRTPLLVSLKQPWGEYLGRTSMDLTPLQFADILVRGDLGLSAIGLHIEIDCNSQSTLPRDLLEFNRMIENWSILGLPLVVFLSVPNSPEGNLENGLQMDYVKHLLQLFTSKSAIHGVVWDPLVDVQPQGCGLLSETGEAKQILGCFQDAARSVF